MKHTVIWQPAAESDLVRLWNGASDRQEVAQAADQIDNLLATRPQSVGESRGDIERILFVPPLTVAYDVFDDDRQVVVWGVWRPQQH